MDISLPDEILCHCGGLLLSVEESGHSGEDREEGAGLQPHHGSFWWDNRPLVSCYCVNSFCRQHSLINNVLFIRKCLHAAEQQQQPLWKVHPAPTRQVPAVLPSSSHETTSATGCSVSSTCYFFYMKVSVVSWSFCANIFTGEDQGGLPASEREELPHFLPGELTDPDWGSYADIVF